MITLEHVNFTVSDAKKTASWMVDVFDWHIRWQGESNDGRGFTVHVGTNAQYIALYSSFDEHPRCGPTFRGVGGLNHIAVCSPDLDHTEKQVRDQGFKVGPRLNYKPGHRFYFFDDDNIEYEVVESR